MIIGLTGPIGSGKSTLARALQARLGGDLLAFGRYVQEQARQMGRDPMTRLSLQHLGQTLAKDAGAFVSDALRWAGFNKGRHCILDGIRHENVWREFRRVGDETGCGSTLVYLAIPERLRQQRLQARGIDLQTARTIDSHPSEQDVTRILYSLADIRLDSAQPPIALAEKIVRQLSL